MIETICMYVICISGLVIICSIIYVFYLNYKSNNVYMYFYENGDNVFTIDDPEKGLIEYIMKDKKKNFILPKLKNPNNEV